MNDSLFDLFRLIILFQLSKVENCRLQLKYQTTFDFRNGACNTFIEDGVENAWLCFGFDNFRACHS